MGISFSEAGFIFERGEVIDRSQRFKPSSGEEIIELE